MNHTRYLVYSANIRSTIQSIFYNNKQVICPIVKKLKHPLLNCSPRFFLFSDDNKVKLKEKKTITMHADLIEARNVTDQSNKVTVLMRPQ